MRKICLLLILIVVPTSLFAQDWREGDRGRRGRGRDRYERRYTDPNRFELTPFGGYTWGGTLFSDTTNLFDRDVDAESAANLGVNFGIPLGDSNMKLELMVNHQATHLTLNSGIFEPEDRLGDFDVTYYHAGLQIPFAQSRNATPYFIVSAGVGTLDPQFSDTRASNRFSASAGAGVKLPVTDNFGIRLEGRGYFTSLGGEDDGCRRCDDTNNHDFYQGQVNIGLVISF